LEIPKSDTKFDDKKNIDGEVNIGSPMGVTGNNTGKVTTHKMTKKGNHWNLD